MTQPTNRFLGGGNGNGGSNLPPFITLPNGKQVPTELQAYCDWLNDLKFWGRWHFVIEADGDHPRRMGVTQVDEDTWKANKARRFQGRLTDDRDS